MLDTFQMLGKLHYTGSSGFTKRRKIQIDQRDKLEDARAAAEVADAVGCDTFDGFETLGDEVALPDSAGKPSDAVIKVFTILYSTIQYDLLSSTLLYFVILYYAIRCSTLL